MHGNEFGWSFAGSREETGVHWQVTLDGVCSGDLHAMVRKQPVPFVHILELYCFDVCDCTPASMYTRAS